MSIISYKWDIENFSRDNNLGLCKMKKQSILIQQKYVEVLKVDAMMPTSLRQAKKTEMKSKARSSNILCLRNKVLREITRENDVIEM